MKKNTLSGLDIDLYSEKFANGFEVYLVPLKNMKRYYATYATKYGSLITEFCPNGSRKNVKVPNGIAHFLEHFFRCGSLGSHPAGKASGKQG